MSAVVHRYAPTGTSPASKASQNTLGLTKPYYCFILSAGMYESYRFSGDKVKGKTMRKLSIVLLMMVAVPFVQAGTGVEYFHSDWDRARKIAKKKGKPLYVHFTTEWCGWCRKIENEVYKSKKGKKALKPFVPVSLDCTVKNKKGKELQQAKENKKLQSRWGGSGYPYLVQVTADGEVFNSWSGYKPVDAFTQELKKALSNLKELKQFEKEAKSADRDSYQFNVKAMKIYRSMKANKKAQKAASQVLKLDPENKKGNNAQAALIRMEGLQKSRKWGEARGYLQKVSKYDPENSKGQWEKATRRFTVGMFRHARMMSPDSRQKNLGFATNMYKKLIDTGSELQKPQLARYFLGMLYGQQGKQKKGIEMLKKAVAVDPQSRMGRRIKKMLQKVKQRQNMKKK